MSSTLDVDLEGDGDGYSGTFRWKKSKKLGSMPQCSTHVKLDVSGGWMEYFLSRGKDDDESVSLVGYAQSDLSLIDCLSTPLTIAKMLTTSEIYKPDEPMESLNIVCIGASSKAEGRVLLETNCFNEISYAFIGIKDINLYLVGPEMSTVPKSLILTHSLRAHVYQGTSMEFFRAHPALLASHTVVVGLNCGFGNWENPAAVRYNLLFQWLMDLYFLTATQLPLFFTCANDYADLIGEIAVMQKIMGCYFLCPPMANTFEYASTMISPPSKSAVKVRKKDSPKCKGVQELQEGEYSRGNSYWYAVQGSDRKRRRRVVVGDTKTLIHILKTVPLIPCEQLRPPVKIASSTSIKDLAVSSFDENIHERVVNGKNIVTDETTLRGSNVPSAESRLHSSEFRNPHFNVKCKSDVKLSSEADNDPGAEKSDDYLYACTAKSAAENPLATTVDSKDESLRTKSRSSDSSSTMCVVKSDPSTSPARASESPRLSKPFTCNQTVERSCGGTPVLAMSFSLSVPVISISDICLDLCQNAQSFRVSVAGYVEDIPLLMKVDPNSIRAKFSKKKKLLRVSAGIRDS